VNLLKVKDIADHPLHSSIYLHPNYLHPFLAVIKIYCTNFLLWLLKVFSRFYVLENQRRIPSYVTASLTEAGKWTNGWMDDGEMEKEQKNSKGMKREN
jgi:hypothetical protein